MSKFTQGLKAVGESIRRSPQVMRKKLGQLKLKPKVGRSSDYSQLDDCEDNGWLHSDDQILVGIPFNVKYLGSMEIAYVPGDAAKNNDLALQVMRKIKAMKIKTHSVTLTISAGRVSLTRHDNHELIMRHSTTRIAYSTVDHQNPKLFCYVALPKSSDISVCHVFQTKGAKMSYQMTFTCAHAFDVNYQHWKHNRQDALLKATASESGDVEPANAIPSPELRRRPMPRAAVPQHSTLRHEASASPTPAASSAVVEAEPSSAVAEEDIGYITIDALEVEDEEDMMASAESYFSKLSAAKSEPSLLEIGVEPEHYNEASSEEDSDE
eukprot:m.96690 g.96690  ORF g.96690 m.96690 type:complete len:324 (+) comp13081_c0_seq1:101-1072(+)